MTSGVCTVDAVTGTLTLIAPGTCTIAADQAGNASWNPAPQVDQSFVVARAHTISGTVTAAGTGVEGAIVYVFDAAHRGLRGQRLHRRHRRLQRQPPAGTYNLWVQTNTAGYPDQAYGGDGSFENATPTSTSPPAARPRTSRWPGHAAGAPSAAPSPRQAPGSRAPSCTCSTRRTAAYVGQRLHRRRRRLQRQPSRRAPTTCGSRPTRLATPTRPTAATAPSRTPPDSTSPRAARRPTSRWPGQRAGAAISGTVTAAGRGRGRHRVRVRPRTVGLRRQRRHRCRGAYSVSLPVGHLHPVDPDQHRRATPTRPTAPTAASRTPPRSTSPPAARPPTSRWPRPRHGRRHQRHGHRRRRRRRGRHRLRVRRGAARPTWATPPPVPAAPTASACPRAPTTCGSRPTRRATPTRPTAPTAASRRHPDRPHRGSQTADVVLAGSVSCTAPGGRHHVGGEPAPGGLRASGGPLHAATPTPSPPLDATPCAFHWVKLQHLVYQRVVPAPDRSAREQQGGPRPPRQA